MKQKGDWLDSLLSPPVHPMTLTWTQSSNYLFSCSAQGKHRHWTLHCSRRAELHFLACQVPLCCVTLTQRLWGSASAPETERAVTSHGSWVRSRRLRQRERRAARGLGSQTTHCYPFVQKVFSGNKGLFEPLVLHDKGLDGVYILETCSLPLTRVLSPWSQVGNGASHASPQGLALCSTQAAPWPPTFSLAWRSRDG